MTAARRDEGTIAALDRGVGDLRDPEPIDELIAAGYANEAAARPRRITGENRGIGVIGRADGALLAAA